MRLTYTTVFLWILFFLTLASCSKFEGDQTIPAYIQIDSIAVKVTSSAQGTASHRITDAWVYVEGQLIGAFELPAKFPVLMKGKKKLLIRPGIRIDGMVEQRSYYPLYGQIEQNILLAEDSVSKPSGTLTAGENVLFVPYREGVQYVWAETFEDENFAIDTTSKSQASFELTETSSPETFEGLHSGRILLTPTDTIFEALSTEAINLPRKGSPVFLEINYRNTNSFTLGLISVSSTQVIQQPILTLNPSATWNKLYLNLTPNASAAELGVKFKLFVAALLDDGKTEGEILIDNMKWVYINQSE